MLVELENLPAPEWALLLPQLIVFGLAIVLLFGDAFIARARHFQVLTALSLVGYGAALVALWWQDGRNDQTFLGLTPDGGVYGLFRADGLTVFLSLIILVAAILTVMISASYVDRLEGRMPIGEFYLLLAFSVLGALLTSAAGDLVMIFIGIELSSLATYVLTAFAKRRLTAVEGALKYFLLGIFASAILVYGMAWVYGATGTTDLDGIARALQPAVAGETALEPSLLLALLLMVVGLGFKMAAVPFHFWTPDAYDGAATPVTAFMSVVPKAAAFAATIRLLVQGLGPMRDDWLNLIAVLALVTMTFGNIVAIAQRNVKRMLAYSSIAHTGYMLVGLAVYREQGGFSAGGSVSGDQGVTSLLFYILAYTVMNIGAFAVVAWLQHRGRGLTLDDFSGLASSSPLAAAAMTVFLVSLMGVPPTIGFRAKYEVILAAINAGTAVGLTLAIAIVVLSAVSAFYYLRVVAAMYFDEPERTPRAESTPLLNVGIGAMAAATLVLGVLFSGELIDLAGRWSQALTVAAQAGAGG
ncbi:MAG: NADH-quinone oxidoreductase subunit N [Chloroflexota bacterium]|nr:NADH-quinone oxidoreductase subunit N [Chloroflexota bacterium]